MSPSPSLRSSSIAASIALLAFAGLTASVVLGDDAAAAKKPTLAIGEAAPAFVAKDLDGLDFSLATARTITDEQALAAVASAAKAYGAGAALKATDGLEKLPGLKKGDAVDRALVVELAQAAGKPYGLIASADTVASWKTVGDATEWIKKSANAPVIFMCWSPKCPTSQAYEERLTKLMSKSGARFFALACNYTDDDEAIHARVDTKHLPFRVLIDRDLKITDVLGGKRTPHVFLFDDKSVLRYCGSIDSDPTMTEPEEKRVTYLANALEALAKATSVDVLMTAPKG